MTAKEITVLLIEEDHQAARRFKAALNASGAPGASAARYSVVHIEDQGEALQILAQNNVDVVVLGATSGAAPGVERIQPLQGILGDRPLLIVNGEEVDPSRPREGSGLPEKIQTALEQAGWQGDETTAALPVEDDLALGTDVDAEQDPVVLDPRKARELAVLQAVARAGTEATSEHALVARATEIIREALYPHNFGVLLVDPEEESLVVHASYQVDAGVRPVGIRVGEGITGQVARTGIARRVGDVREDPDYLCFDEDTRSELCVPLRVGDRVIGVINVESDQVDGFDEEDERLLSILAGQLATAIEKVRLFEMERRQRARAETLRRVGLAMGSTIELSDLLNLICRESLTLFGAGATYVWLVEGDELVGIAGQGTSSERFLGLRVPLCDPDTLGARVIRERRPIFINQAAQSKQVNQQLVEMFQVRSILGVPLLKGAKEIGALMVLHTEEGRSFGEEDIEVALALGSHAAVAIENARLFEQERRQREESEALRRAVEGVASTLELQDVLEGILTHLERVVPYDSACIFLVEGNALHAVAGRNFPNIEQVVGQYYPLEKDGIHQEIRRLGRPLIYPNVQEVPIFNKWGGTDYVRGWMGVPLMVRGRVIGHLTIDSRQEGAYGEREAALAQALAHQAAIAIDNARLYQESQRQSRELAGLYDTALATNSVLVTEALLARLEDQIHQLLVPDSLGVFFYDPDSREIEVALAVEEGRKIQEMIGARLPEDQGGLTSWVIRSRRPLLIGDLNEEDAPVEPRHITRPARSWLGVPLIARDRLIGAISLQSFGPGAFSKGDIRFLESLAAQVAVALENARLYEAAQRGVARREALNRVVAAAAAATDLPSLLEAALDHTLSALQLQCGAIWVNGDNVTRELPQHTAVELAQAAKQADYDFRRSPEPVVVEDWTQPDPDPALQVFAPAIAELGVRASCMVPILSEGEPIGALAVASHQPQQWREEDVELVKAVGSQVGATVVRLRMFAHTQRHAEYMERLVPLSEALNRPLSVPEVLKVIGEGALSLTGVSRAAVYLRGADDTATSPWHRGLSTAYLDAVCARLDEVPGGRMLADSNPILIEDVEALPEEHAIRELANTEGFRALGLWPLVYEGQAGAAFGCYYDSPHRLTEPEREALSAFARQAAVALENARLFEEVRSHIGKLATLYEIGKDVTASHDLNALLHMITERASQLTGASKGMVLLVDDGNRTLIDAVGVGFDRSQLKGMTFQEVQDGISGWVLKTRQATLSNNLGDDARNTGLALERLQQEATPGRYLAVAPMIANERLIGTLSVINNEDREPFNQEHLDVVSMLASQAAIAVENVRLLEAERQSKQQLARSNALITALGKVAASLGNAHDPDAVMHTVGDELRKLGFHCYVALMEPASKDMVIRYVSVVPKMLSVAEKLVGLELHNYRLKRENFALYADLVDQRRSVFTREGFALVRPLVGDVPERLARLALKWAGIDEETVIITVPLTVGERVLGAFGLWSNELQASGVTAVSIFASQMAVALENARLLEAESRRRVELEAIREASLQVTSSLELNPVLEAILRQALQLVSGDDAHVFLYDEGRLTFGAAMWAGNRQQAPFSEPREDGFTAAVARTGERIVVPRVNDHPLFADYQWGGAIVGLPLRRAGHVFGVMNVAFETPHEFDEAELRVLELLADQAAIALENARLYEALHARVDELEAIAQSSAALRGAGDYQTIGQMITQQAARLVQADKAALFQVDPDRGHLVPLGVVGLPDELLSFRLEASAGLVGQVLRTNQVIRSARLSEEAHPRLRELLVDGGHGLCVPLRAASDRVVGALLAVRGPGPDGSAAQFDQQAERLLVTLAEIAGTALQRAQAFEELELAYLETVLSLAKAMDARDSYTGDHSQRLAAWAERVAFEMSCDGETIQAILWAALLHDIGKIGVPDHILRKPGPLTEEEWGIMKRHPVIGAEIVAPVRSLDNVAPLIRSHQEHYDGSGYPDGLRGTSIPLGARILAVVDAYSAITDDRVYRKARSHEEALAELRRCAGTQFDPEVVGVFLKIQSDDPPHSSHIEGISLDPDSPAFPSNGTALPDSPARGPGD